MTWGSFLAKASTKIGSRLSLKAVSEGAAKLSLKGLLKVGLSGGVFVGVVSFFSSIPSAISNLSGGLISSDMAIILIGGVACLVIIAIARRG
jgi:hypothetical protein